MKNPDIDDLHLVPEDKTAIQQKLLLGVKYVHARQEAWMDVKWVRNRPKVDLSAALPSLAQAIAHGLVPVKSEYSIGDGAVASFGSDLESNEKSLAQIQQKKNGTDFQEIENGILMPFLGDYRETFGHDYQNVTSHTDDELLSKFCRTLMDYRAPGRGKFVIRDIVTDMLALHVWHRTCTISSLEIALLHLSEEADFAEAGDIIPAEVRKAVLTGGVGLSKARHLRRLLMDESEKRQPSPSYIASCEGFALDLYGEKKLTAEIMPMARAISRMLNATGYFSYQMMGYTQQISIDLETEQPKANKKKADKMPAFMEKVLAFFLQKHRNSDIDEYDQPLLTMVDVRFCFSLFTKKSVRALEPSNIQHICGRYPLANKVLAEVVGGAFLRLLDAPLRAGENCVYSRSKGSFCDNAGPLVPDAFAVHKKFTLTVEISMAQSKSGPDRKDPSKTIFETDIESAIKHVHDFAREQDMQYLPQFVMLLTNDIPMDDSSMNLILFCASFGGYPTIIPATFETMVNLIDNMRGTPAKIESSQVLAFLQGCESGLKSLHSALVSFKKAKENHAKKREAYVRDAIEQHRRLSPSIFAFPSDDRAIADIRKKAREEWDSENPPVQPSGQVNMLKKHGFLTVCGSIVIEAGKTALKIPKFVKEDEDNIFTKPPF